MDLGSTQLFDVVPGVAETVSFKANLAVAATAKAAASSA
jgi:hypothetical protein